MSENNYNNSAFMSGYVQLKISDTKSFKDTLKERLGWSDQTLCYRMRGRVEPKKSEMEVIEQTFAEFGVTSNIWGM